MFSSFFSSPFLPVNLVVRVKTRGTWKVLKKSVRKRLQTQSWANNHQRPTRFKVRVRTASFVFLQPLPPQFKKTYREQMPLSGSYCVCGWIWINKMFKYCIISLACSAPFQIEVYFTFICGWNTSVFTITCIILWNDVIKIQQVCCLFSSTFMSILLGFSEPFHLSLCQGLSTLMIFLYYCFPRG